MTLFYSILLLSPPLEDPEGLLVPTNTLGSLAIATTVPPYKVPSPPSHTWSGTHYEPKDLTSASSRNVLPLVRL